WQEALEDILDRLVGPSRDIAKAIP
ncbi:hypothetical protein GGR33_005167, partial [Methylobacterium brachythecii]|nr:hypothetical protein [Methylobacterium brachythecii]